MGVALLKAQEGFRRVRGHKELGAGNRAGALRFCRLAATLCGGRKGKSRMKTITDSHPPPPTDFIALPL